MASPSDSRTPVAAILGGVLIFSGQAGELAFGSPSDLVDALFVALTGLGVASLVVAIWRLGGLVSTKVGRIGWRFCVAGVVLLGLFVFEGAWVALGGALLRPKHRPGPETASALI